MALLHDIDYKNNQFEYPELTRIIGEPSTSSLIVLLKEIRANASSVQSDLGGGEDGHLGLVCTDEVYESLVLNAIPYIRPENPGRLQVNAGFTQYAIAQARNEHAEATRVFREVIGVERALQQQLVAAIEPKYLRALRTPGTNKLTQTIPQIFDHLFSTYGDVAPQDLRELTTRVESLTFSPQEPVDTIFREMDNLATISEHANAPITASQRINMAYLYFQRSCIYKSALTRWDESDDNGKTWQGFKEHFRSAHKASKRTGALTINETMNHAAVANMVQAELQQAMLAQEQPPSPPPPLLTEQQLPAPPPLTSTTSSTSSATVASELTMHSMQQQLALMHQMMLQQMALAQQPMCQPITNEDNNRPRRRKRNQQKYCWTHGACNHWGCDCRTKAKGHDNTATFQDRKGGSNKNLE